MNSSRPRAFRLPAGAPEAPPAPSSGPRVEEQADAFAPATADLAEAAVETAQQRGFLARAAFTWAGLFWTALGGLVSLAIGLWLTQLVESLFAQSFLAGGVGLALTLVALLAALVLLVREIAAIFRQQKIARLHLALAQARAADDRDAARRRVQELAALYAARRETVSARAELVQYGRDIIDGRDLIDLAERSLMLPLDREARGVIAACARNVSLFTAISPRAVFEVVYVAAQLIWLMRRIAEIYGGRPGLLGFFKLARSVGVHLAVTGGMAVGDSVAQQILGHGLAAKLSTRLGEGVLNGLLTARVGLSAMAVCRPMPFGVAPAPGVKDVAPELFKGLVIQN